MTQTAAASPLCLHYGFERLRPITMACMTFVDLSSATMEPHQTLNALLPKLRAALVHNGFMAKAYWFGIG